MPTSEIKNFRAEHWRAFLRFVYPNSILDIKKVKLNRLTSWGQGDIGILHWMYTVINFEKITYDLLDLLACIM